MDDRHLVVLQGIWGEMKTMNGRINDLADAQLQTNARLDETNARLDKAILRLDGVELGVQGLSARMDRLERVQIESETRLATELVAVVAAVHEVRDVIRAGRSDRKRLDKLEKRVEALEKKSA